MERVALSYERMDTLDGRTGSQVRLHGSFNVRLDQFELQRLAISSTGSVNLHIARVGQTERRQEHAAYFVLLAVPCDSSKVHHLDGCVLEFKCLGVETADLLLHGIDNRLAVGMNIEFGPLFFFLKQRTELVLPLTNAHGKLCLGSVLFGSLGKLLNVSATEILKGSGVWVRVVCNIVREKRNEMMVSPVVLKRLVRVQENQTLVYVPRSSL